MFWRSSSKAALSEPQDGSESPVVRKRQLSGNATRSNGNDTGPRLGKRRSLSRRFLSSLSPSRSTSQRHINRSKNINEENEENDENLDDDGDGVVGAPIGQSDSEKKLDSGPSGVEKKLDFEQNEQNDDDDDDSLSSSSLEMKAKTKSKGADRWGSGRQRGSGRARRRQRRKAHESELLCAQLANTFREPMSAIDRRLTALESLNENVAKLGERFDELFESRALSEQRLGGHVTASVELARVDIKQALESVGDRVEAAAEDGSGAGNKLARLVELTERQAERIEHVERRLESLATSLAESERQRAELQLRVDEANAQLERSKAVAMVDATRLGQLGKSAEALHMNVRADTEHIAQLHYRLDSLLSLA
jgi:chromosome segregation ATPase